MFRVILDAAHGGNDIGKIHGNRTEKDDNLKLAMRIGHILTHQHGYDVIYTRTSDVYVSQTERVNIINEANGDLVLSLHRLYGDDRYKQEGGISFFVPQLDGTSERVAESIRRNLTNLAFQGYELLIRNDLLILRDTSTATVLAGIGYLNSEADNIIFDSRLDEIAEKIAQGIVDVMNHEEKQKSTKESEGRITVHCRKNLRRRGEMSVNQANTNHYRVQVGLFFNYNNALDTMIRLFREGYPAEIHLMNQLYAVTVGYFTDLDDAVILERRLRRDGYNTLIIAV